jgi:hypothetical protein
LRPKNGCQMVEPSRLAGIHVAAGQSVSKTTAYRFASAVTRMYSDIVHGFHHASSDQTHRLIEKLTQFVPQAEANHLPG